MHIQAKILSIVVVIAALASTARSDLTFEKTELELHPAFLVRQAEEPAKSKTIVAKAGKDISIKNLDVSSSSPDFVAKVEPGSAAGEFRINIEPKQTNQATAATLTIKPALANGKPKVFYAS